VTGTAGEETDGLVEVARMPAAPCTPDQLLGRRPMIESPANDATWEDPIVAEVRRVRQKLFAEAGNDLDEFVRCLRLQQSTSGHRVVTRPPRGEGDRPEHEA
jgi:hypothetical protein